MDRNGQRKLPFARVGDQLSLQLILSRLYQVAGTWMLQPQTALMG